MMSTACWSSKRASASVVRPSRITTERGRRTRDGERQPAIPGAWFAYSPKPTFSKWRLRVGVIAEPITFLFIR